MSDAKLLLQKAIYAALTGDVTLMAKITGVFDFIPDAQAYPFVQIGEGQFNEWDTNTDYGFDGTLTINVWHRPGERGRAPIYDIQADIYRILHNSTPSVSGFSIPSFRVDFSDIVVDTDAVTYHGIQRLKILMGGN